MDENDASYRHVIAALVVNEPGVLARVAGMFAARGFNIDSLVVGRTEKPDLSRMTIVANGDLPTIEQIRKQLAKLVEVVQVVDYSEADVVERDLMLVRVNAPPTNRSAVIEIADLFRARVVDVATEALMVELSGTEDKIEAFIDLVRPHGIVELARTGVIAMPRGERVSGQAPTSRKRRAAADTGDSDGDTGGAIDPRSLPPG
ncbi:MAG: acetolactate synthase small subunit [Planctomycetaceae bacterium]|nr:acetolactate synthase small subunit [Planctomycetaceae bacterium]